MNRAMALDLGDRRVGIAMSDLMKMIANGYETYYRSGDESRDIEYIKRLVVDNNVDEVVIGLPINMDGTEGVRVEKSREFGQKLGEIIDAKIFFEDERLTTVSAERVLIEGDVRRDKRKTVIDMVAATIILQAFLDKRSRGY